LITVSIGIALPAVNPNPRKSLEKPEIACLTRTFNMQLMPTVGKGKQHLFRLTRRS